MNGQTVVFLTVRIHNSSSAAIAYNISTKNAQIGQGNCNDACSAYIMRTVDGVDVEVFDFVVVAESDGGEDELTLQCGRQSSVQ